jgi:hypothetical protein
MKKINYVNGKLHGKYFDYYQNGQKNVEAVYINNKITKITWFHQNGNKSREHYYVNDKLHGKFINWNFDGTVHTDTTYLNGEDIQMNYLEYKLFHEFALSFICGYMFGEQNSLFYKNKIQNSVFNLISEFLI